MIEVVYFAHPLGGDVDGNAARSRRWLRWLMDCEPGYAFCCPWLPYVDIARPEDKEGPGAVDPSQMPAYRQRAFRDDLAIAARCDGIVLVGERISPGMKGELEAVVDRGGWVSDLTDFKESIMTKRDWEPGAGPVATGRHWWAGTKRGGKYRL